MLSSSFLCFSGFKDQSTTSSLLLCDSKTAVVTTRKSNRVQERKQVEVILTPNEKLVEKFLTSQKNPQKFDKSIKEALNSFNPRVLLCKFCINFENAEYLRKIDLSTFLTKFRDITEIEFTGMIMYKLENHNEAKFYVRWIPEKILDDEFMKFKDAQKTKLKRKVKVCELNFKQRQIVSEKILSGKLKF